MSRLSWIFAVVLMCANSVDGAVEGSRTELQTDVRDILSQSVDNFNLPSEPQNPLQKDDKLKNMTPEERRQFEAYLYKTYVGICNAKNIDTCHHKDVKFFASLVAKGDQECVVTCSKEKMLENKDKLPNGEKSIDFIVAIETYMKDLDEDSTEDRNEVATMNDQGCSTVEGDDDECGQRRVFLLPFIPAIIGLVKLAGIAAAGYITEMSERESTGYLQKGNAAASQVIVKLAKVNTRAAGRGCFSADSLVNVKTNTGSVVSKPLRSLSLGDMVESVDEQTGQLIYSKVYYIAHDQEDSHTQLLRILYNDRFNVTKSLGISDRHLIYVTKNGQSTEHAPLEHPILAKEVKEGDFIWTMEEGELVPRKVTDVMTYFGAFRHPLTENHHVVVDGVHASVHILNEKLYRKLSYPLRWTFWANPEWNRSWLVKKLVRVVENGKEPFFTSSPTELMEYWTGSALPTLFSSPTTF